MTQGSYAGLSLLPNGIPSMLLHTCDRSSETIIYKVHNMEELIDFFFTEIS